MLPVWLFPSHMNFLWRHDNLLFSNVRKYLRLINPFNAVSLTCLMANKPAISVSNWFFFFVVVATIYRWIDVKTWRHLLFGIKVLEKHDNQLFIFKPIGDWISRCLDVCSTNRCQYDNSVSYHMQHLGCNTYQRINSHLMAEIEISSSRLLYCHDVAIIGMPWIFFQGALDVCWNFSSQTRSRCRTLATLRCKNL